MLNMMKMIVRRNWAFLLLILAFALLSYFVIEDKVALTVLFFIAFFAAMESDMKEIAFECSLPIDRRKVADARFLLILILLSVIAAMYIPKSIRLENLARFAPALAITLVMTSLWLTSVICIGKGNNALKWIYALSLIPMMFVILRLNLADSLSIDNIGNGTCFLMMALGLGVFCILWLISRNRIGKTDF